MLRFDQGFHVVARPASRQRAAFELESGRGKHAEGALLNLAAYSVIGVLGTETRRAEEMLNRSLQTYRAALGLRNVFVRKMP